MYKGSKIFRNQIKNVFRNDCTMRSKHLNEGFKLQKFQQTSKSFHKQQVSEYPATKQLPLPSNIKDLASSEKLKFSPLRTRDISSSYISSSTSSFTDVKSNSRIPVDDRAQCYDCSGAINLSSAMQTNVPFPFVSGGKPIHLNMPGGQWRQKEKYVSEDLNNVHHINTRELSPRSGTTCSLGNSARPRKVYFYTPCNDFSFFTSPGFLFSNFNTCQLRMFSSVKGNSGSSEKYEDNFKPLTLKGKLKAALKDYAPVIIVCYVGTLLVCTGCFYILIYSGVDLSSFFKSFGADEGAATAKTAAGFVVPFAIHKSLLPAQIAVTLGAAPFIVRQLRKRKLKGMLKTPRQQ